MSSPNNISPPARMRSHASNDEVNAYRELVERFRASPIPPAEILANLSLYLTRSALAQILFMRDLYNRIVDVHGVVMEFGNRWGRNLALFATLRNILEPHNYGRRIIGFDTFEGFLTVTSEDGADDVIRPGSLAVTRDYQIYLDEVLGIHERLGPRPHLKRCETVKGDVETTLPTWLQAHPETVIAFAYFDMDLYRPTKAALEAIRPYLVKGSVVAFDELCVTEFPGETLAVREVLDLSQHALRRSPYSNYQSYIVL